MTVATRVSPKSYLDVRPCLARHFQTRLLITSLVYHKSVSFASKILENISAKDIDIYPKEAYNKGIGSERIREKPKMQKRRMTNGRG
nr:MAG TPA: hypothetical protein [Bacteriophage sp.]